jgi:hypothetical protein
MMHQSPAGYENAVQAYRHDPYDFERSTFVSFYYPSSPAAEPARPKTTAIPTAGAILLPEASSKLLHPMLAGCVTFLQLHDQALLDVDELMKTDEEVSESMQHRAFVGQLPFQITERHLVWLCAQMGVRICNPQRILKFRDGIRMPTGGVHVQIHSDDYMTLHQNMHKRVLIDESGIWFAADESQKHALDSYVHYLHHNKKERPTGGMPYDTVVVQQAASNFVPRRQRRFDDTRC